MNRNDIDWHGYIPAITTPFRRDRSIAWDDFATQLEWLLNEGVPGVLVAGTTGEWFSMSAEERAKLFSTARRTVRGRCWVLGGCNAYTADEAVLHARAAEAAQLDGIVLTPPPYVVPTRDEIAAFYRNVAGRTRLPLCVYNWPRGCVVDMDKALLTEIAQIDTVVAVKNSTPDLGTFLDGFYALADQVRWFGIPSYNLGIDLSRVRAVDGLMGAGGVLAADQSGFWRALESGDLNLARALGKRDELLMQRWFTRDYGGRFGSAQSILKTALRLRGVPAGYVRPPLLELDADGVDAVRSTLVELGVEVVEPA